MKRNENIIKEEIMRFAPIILISLISISLHCQDYIPVLSVDTIQWNYLSDASCGDCIETITFTSYGDTIIGGENYRKVYKNHSWNKPSELFGFINEDTILDKMSLRTYAFECQDYPCISNTIYTMNLNLGDTLIRRSYYDTVYQIVTDVGIDGNRKYIEFGNQEFRLIEGIGSTREMTAESHYSHGISELLCKYHNNEIVFSRTVLGHDTCYLFLVTSNEDQKKSEITIVPNPVSISQPFEIKGLESDEFQLDIYTITGVHVLRKRLVSTMTVNPAEFTTGKGLYILHISRSQFTESRLLFIN